MIAAQTFLNTDKERPKQKQLFIPVFFLLPAGQRKKPKRGFSPAFAVLEQGPQKVPGPVLTAPGIGIKGKKKKPDFILPEYPVNLPGQREKSKVAAFLF